VRFLAFVVRLGRTAKLSFPVVRWAAWRESGGVEGTRGRWTE
jgi:hypothetical protein